MMKRIRIYLVAAVIIVMIAGCRGSKHRPKHRKCDCPTFSQSKIITTLKTV